MSNGLMFGVNYTFSKAINSDDNEEVSGTSASRAAAFSGIAAFGIITSTLNLAGQWSGTGGERQFWFAGKVMF